MIGKLDMTGRTIYENTAIAKLNEVIDAVNKLHEEAENNARIRANHENLIDTLVQESNIHERQIDELQMKLEPEKCETPAENAQDEYAEQRKWIGKLCRFWDDNKKEWVIDFLRAVAYGYADTPYRGNKDWYEHCEPVKPDDSIIYRGK